jgi:hypothetical protein
VTAGTIFEKSRMPLRLWFRAAWWMTNQKTGVSAMGLQRTLGVGSYRTAWACLHKLRRAMIRAGRESLNGAVEVDETLVGGRQRNIGGLHMGKNKFLVAIAVEIRGNGCGRIRLKRISDTSAKSLEGFVSKLIVRGTQVVTDGRWGYTGLPRLGYDYHPMVLARKGKDASTLLLPRVHRVASLLKRWLLGTHQGRFSGKHLDRYLDEFTFRFNRRASVHRGMLFYRLLQQAVATEPVTHRKIVTAFP